MPPTDVPRQSLPPIHIHDAPGVPRPPMQVSKPVSVPEKSTVGPIVGAIIIIFLFAFGGLYFWGAYLNKEAAKETSPVPLIQ